MQEDDSTDNNASDIKSELSTVSEAVNKRNAPRKWKVIFYLLALSYLVFVTALWLSERKTLLSLAETRVVDEKVNIKTRLDLDSLTARYENLLGWVGTQIGSWVRHDGNVQAFRLHQGVFKVRVDSMDMILGGLRVWGAVTNISSVSVSNITLTFGEFESVTQIRTISSATMPYLASGGSGRFNATILSPLVTSNSILIRVDNFWM